MEYLRLSKSRGFKYACNSHLYSQYSKKKRVMYLKCDTADCKRTAIPRTASPIHANSKTADLLPKAITCRFNYLQIHTTQRHIDLKVCLAEFPKKFFKNIKI